MKRARPAGDDQRMVRTALSCKQRDAAQLEHRQHVRIGEFVLEAEADDVERVQRTVGFERHERNVMLAQLPLHVRPGRVHAFGLHVGATVQQVVQNLEAEVRLRDFVHFGKGEAEAQTNGSGVFDDGAEFAPGIAGRMFDQRKDCGVRPSQVGVLLRGSTQ